MVVIHRFDCSCNDDRLISGTTEKIEVSSTKSLAVDDRSLDKSLIYTKNNRGPKIDPEACQLALVTMKMTDHLTGLFEIYLIGSSQWILVVDSIFLGITVDELGLHARLNQMLWICQKIYIFNLKRWTTVK